MLLISSLTHTQAVRQVCSRIVDGGASAKGLTLASLAQSVAGLGSSHCLYADEQGHGLPEMDLMLKFGRLESLCGILPWQIRLTEI